MSAKGLPEKTSETQEMSRGWYEEEGASVITPASSLHTFHVSKEKCLMTIYIRSSIMAARPDITAGLPEREN
jgi:hypothetical protein